MGRINGWQRKTHYSNLDEAERELDDRGRVTIGEWWNPEVNARVKHIWEPAAEMPFIVELTDDTVVFDEEGRYRTREEGGDANKRLMEKYP